MLKKIATTDQHNIRQDKPFLSQTINNDIIKKYINHVDEHKETLVEFKKCLCEDYISNEPICIHNFANQIKPGISFPNNGTTQEEVLLRKFPHLFHSLHYYKDLYPIDSKNSDVICTDYVKQWRDNNYRIIIKKEQRKCMFVTAAAPDHYNYKFNEKRVLNNIRNIILFLFFFAIINKKRVPTVLVTGGWGCGAFCLDDHKYKRSIKPYLSKTHKKCNDYIQLMASLYKQVLIDEGYTKYYETIIFAIPDKDMCTKFKSIIIG